MSDTAYHSPSSPPPSHYYSPSSPPIAGTRPRGRCQGHPPVRGADGLEVLRQCEKRRGEKGVPASPARSSASSPPILSSWTLRCWAAPSATRLCAARSPSARAPTTCARRTACGPSSRGSRRAGNGRGGEGGAVYEISIPAPRADHRGCERGRSPGLAPRLCRGHPQGALGQVRGGEGEARREEREPPTGGS